MSFDSLIQVANMLSREIESFASVKYFLDRFPCMQPDGSSLDDIQMEFLLYQTDPLTPAILAMPEAEDQWLQLAREKDVNGALK